MKIPRITDVKTAVTLAGVSFAAALFVKLFGPAINYLLLMFVCVALCYAAVLKWAPEFFADKSQPPSP